MPTDPTTISRNLKALIDIPPNLSMRIPLSNSELTEQGKARFSDPHPVKAGVLGLTTRFTDHCLWITPIAVFARIER